MTETKFLEITFTDNKAALERPDRYLTIDVDVGKVINSWRTSLFAHEWILPDGRIKELGELSEDEQPKRTEIEEQANVGKPLEKPVLGIGLLENIEIGIGRHVFLIAAAQGLQQIPVHIPKSNKDDFESFLA